MFAANRITNIHFHGGPGPGMIKQCSKNNTTMYEEIMIAPVYCFHEIITVTVTITTDTVKTKRKIYYIRLKFVYFYKNTD